MYMHEGDAQVTSDSWLYITIGVTALATVILSFVPAALFKLASDAVLMLF
jgi:hypothetical protein